MESLIYLHQRQVPQQSGLHRSRDQDHDPQPQSRLFRLIHRLILHLLVPPVHNDLNSELVLIIPNLKEHPSPQ